MGAVEDRLDLAEGFDGKTELDVVREYLRVQLSSEGTQSPPEHVGTGDGSTVLFTLDHSPVLAGTLRLYVDGSLQTEGATGDYTVNLATGEVTFDTAPALDEEITALYSYGNDPVGADDTTLAIMLASAKETADLFCNNPFPDGIPWSIKQWVLQRIARLYEFRAEGMTNEQIAGLGATRLDAEDFRLLKYYKVVPGF